MRNLTKVNHEKSGVGRMRVVTNKRVHLEILCCKVNVQWRNWRWWDVYSYVTGVSSMLVRILRVQQYRAVKCIDSKERQ